MHTFEQEPAEFTDFTATGRVAFSTIEAQNSEIMQNKAAHAVLNSNPLPTLVFGEHLQLIYANPAAQKFAKETDMKQLIGLRLGEFLGIEHQMKGHRCGDPDGCANCNELPVIEAALQGRPSVQVGDLMMDPNEPAQCRNYSLLGAPFPLNGKTLALLYLIKA